MNHRPRIPLWAAAAIPAVAYAVRSLIRGSMTPDLPGDAIVLGALLGVIVLSALAGTAAQERRDDLTGQVDDRDGAAGGKRHRDEIGADVQTRGTGSARSADERQPSTDRDA